MNHPLICKLEHSAALSQVERSALEALTLSRRPVSARHDIAVHDNTDRVYLVMSGIAGRYKTLRQGNRRIVSFAVPGDLCRMHICGPSTRDMRLGALTHCTVVDIPRTRLTELIETHPGIAHVMRWLAMMELNRAREWLVNDSRPADRRLAHHFCELLVCLQVVGLANENSFELAISQADLADAMGISQVHINRVLQGLRAGDLIVWSKSALTIPDVERLQAFAEFDPGYLDLRPAKAA
ncbi:Crp/Fnr family transcriptional regulator [Methylobacterium oxalidis]|uniref:Crp/Fnr family transcriptional regulator n=1 Tax=Methylobacterium oxalidis TaxID=944322 RepID=UPI00147886C8|nr:Crp/Fnr family transcriptional regulator [Methylobacterium oxalidis]